MTKEPVRKRFFFKLRSLLEAGYAGFKPGFRHYAAAIFIALFLVHGNSLRNGFVDFDDTAVLQSGRGLMAADPAAYYKDAWSVSPGQAVRHLFTTRPLRDVSLFADKLLFGEDPWGFHLSNLLYQYAAALGAFLAAALLLGSRPAGLLAALIFTLHPAQTEAVAYIAGRRDILYGGLCLYSLYFLASYQDKRRAPLLWLAAAAWALALLGKQSAVALPPAALALLYFRDPASFRGALRSGAARAALGLAAASALIFAGINLYEQALLAGTGTLGDDATYFGGSLTSQVMSLPPILALAVGKALLPLKLVGDYSYAAIAPVLSPADWRLWGALAGLGALGWLAAARRKAVPMAAGGALFFLISYAPVLPVLPLTHNLEVFAEHWLYLPLFGLSVAAAAAALRLRGKGPILFAGLAALLMFYGGRSALRNQDWKEPLVFWEKTAADSPRCARALANLGALYAESGRPAEAEALHKKALEIRPGYIAPLLNLARLRLAAGDHAGALAFLDEAAARPGTMLHARHLIYNRGAVYLGRGDLEKARTIFGEAVHYRPIFHYTPTTHGYALTNLLLGNEAAAEKYFRKALELDPGHFPSAHDLGTLYYRRGAYQAAASLFRRAAELNPLSADSFAYLAVCESFAGDYKGALQSASRALYLAPRSAEPRIAAALVYRRAGKFRAALGYARRGLALEKNSSRLLLEQGVNLRELGEVNGALQSFEKSLTLDPRSAETFLHYADALWAAGYREGARRALGKALLLRPGWPEALKALQAAGGSRR